MEREHCTVLAKAAKTPWRIWQLKEQSRKLWPFFQIGPNAVRCKVAQVQGTVLVERCRESAEPVQVIAANYSVIPMCLVGCGRAMGNQNYQILSDICGKL